MVRKVCNSISVERLREVLSERRRLDRRADATIDFIAALADAGDEKAIAFLNKLFGGGFDWPPDEPAKRG